MRGRWVILNPVTYALHKELKLELSTLFDIGCIKPYISPYSSTLVLVRKKGDGLRVCVDYRGINRDTIPDKYPIPCIDELIYFCVYLIGFNVWLPPSEDGQGVNA